MHGSFINQYAGSDVKPEVGVGGTVMYWSDREPVTVIEVSPSGKTVKVQADSYTRVDTNGMSDAQRYEYERNPNGTVMTFRYSAKWKAFKSGSTKLVLGRRERYYDFSF